VTTSLTVHNAEIKTATVEIQTLTISGKQVTLAVFRQLREEPLISDDGVLNGEPWGTVNYHPDKCGPNADVTDHLHVVWQRGADLLRASVECEPIWPWFWSDAGRSFLSAHLRDLLVGRESGFWDNDLPVATTVDGAGAVLAQHANIEVGIRPSKSAVLAADAIRNTATLADLQDSSQVARFFGLDGDPVGTWRAEHARPMIAEQQRTALEGLNKELRSANAESATERFYAAFDEEVTQEYQRRRRHEAAIAALVDLPQLFIAV
jgi:hypothetical protein